MTDPTERILRNRTLKRHPASQGWLLRAAGTGDLLATYHGNDFGAALTRLRSIPPTGRERRHASRRYLTAAARNLIAAVRVLRRSHR